MSGIEALGLLSSVAGLVSLAAKVAQQVSLFVEQVQSDKSGETAIQVHLLRITRALVLVQRSIISLPDGLADVLRLDATLRLAAIVDESIQALTGLQYKYSYQVPKTGVRRIVWLKKPLKDSRLRADIETLESMASKIEIVVSLLEPVEQSPTKSPSLPHLNDEQSKLLHWLSPLNYRDMQHEHRYLRASGTTPWLLLSREDATAGDVTRDRAVEQYIDWKLSYPRTGFSTILWCRGVAGSGKTTLMSFMIDKFSEELSQDCAMAYYFFDYRTQRPLSDVAAILLKQLALQSPALLSIVRTLHERYQSGQQRPLLNDCLDALQTLPSHFRRTYIVVDAVDEHEAYKQSEMVSFLIGIRNLGCHVVLSSRPEESIPKIDFRNGDRNKLNLSPMGMVLSRSRSVFKFDVSSTEQEIRTYIRTRIDQASALEYLDDMLKDKIVSRLVAECAKKEFLFAVLQVNRVLAQVTTVTTEKDINELLSNLPTEFGDAVDLLMKRALDSSKEPERDLARSTFVWLLFARRPLSMRELCEVLAIEAKEKSDDRNFAERLVPNSTIIQQACAGLVNIDESSSTVSFIHYLVHQHVSRRRFERFPQGPRQLALTCATYMLEQCQTFPLPVDDSSSIDAFRARPFLAYASEQWMHHCREKSVDDDLIWGVPSSFVDPTEKSKYVGKITDKTLQLLAIKSRFESSLVLDRSDHGQPSPTSIKPTRDGLQSIHLAVRFELLDELEILIARGSASSCTDELGITPLHEAAAVGSEELAKFLINKGANSVASNTKAFPVHYAAYHGHDGVLNLLVDDNTDAKDDAHMTPLHYAVKMGHRSTVELLLELGDLNRIRIDLATKGHQDRTLLHTAASNGHAQIVGVLCQAKCPLDLLDKTGMAPLHLAAKRGSESCVRKLLTYGADLNVKGLQNTTPLHQAVLERRPDIVALLLDNGADVNASEVSEKSALSYAIELKDVDLVRLLVDRGASVRRSRQDGETPLHEAARAGQEDVVMALLKAGADPLQQNQKHNTARDIAWQEGKPFEILNILDGGLEVS